MTWQRYKLNLRNSLLLEEYFRVVEQFDSTLSSVIDSTSVPAKRIRTSRRYVLNIYTCNNAYADVFQTDFG